MSTVERSEFVTLEQKFLEQQSKVNKLVIELDKLKSTLTDVSIKTDPSMPPLVPKEGISEPIWPTYFVFRFPDSGRTTGNKNA